MKVRSTSITYRKIEEKLQECFKAKIRFDTALLPIIIINSQLLSRQQNRFQ